MRVFKSIYIVTSLLLTALHAVAVPLHVTTEHHPCPSQVNHHACAGDAAHGDCHAHHHQPHAEGNCSDSELFCDCGSRDPYDSHAHKHSITDHGFVRNRADVLPMPMLALLALPVLHTERPSHAPIPDGAHAPPGRVVTDTSSLRGPPVCS